MKTIIENIEKTISKEHAKIALITELDDVLQRKTRSLEWAKEYAEQNSDSEYAKSSYENELRDFEIFKDTFEKAVTLISNI